MTPLLQVDSLRIAYGSGARRVIAVDDVSFELQAGATLGIVGESGSGKSQTALALMGLNPSQAQLGGRVVFNGENLLDLPEPRRRALRGSSIATVFQDPMSSLNPYLRIGVQLAEVLEMHRGATRAQALAQAAQALDAVRVSAARARLDQYPHELSGGMRQRAMIAMAIIASPQLLIADEPTTALDPTVQLQILKLLDELRRDRGLAIVLITHDLGVVARLCERALVMHAGQVVESASTADLLRRPRHPYTDALLKARPLMHQPPGLRLEALPGQPPDARLLGTGCRFAPRCAFVQADCASQMPPLVSRDHDDLGRLRCHHPLRPANSRPSER